MWKPEELIAELNRCEDFAMEQMVEDIILDCSLKNKQITNHLHDDEKIRKSLERILNEIN